jgi:hypothetical protein
VAQLQHGEVVTGLVGDEDLEAVPVGIGERQLRAGVGIFAAADRSVPAGQPDRSRVASSATSAPWRGVVSASTAGCQASAATASTAARTCSVAGSPIENPMPRSCSQLVNP